MQLFGITGAIGHGKTSLAEAFLKAEPHSLHLESFHIIAQVAEAWHKKLGDIPSPDDLESINDWLHDLPHVLEKQLHLEHRPEPIVLTVADIHANPAEYDKLFVHLRTLRSSPELAKQQITNATKPAYRPILQWIGGFVTMHIDARAWYRELIRQAHEAEHDGVELALIGGLRFPNDAAVIREAGGQIIKIVRPAAPQPDAQDPTEREREAIPHDITVLNNGSLADLEACAQRIVADLHAGRLQREYAAAA